jgi:hypothetical protein
MGYINLKDYQSVAEFAKTYVSRIDGSVGVHRVRVYKLIQDEIQMPGSTDIDVLEVSGSYYVKLNAKAKRNTRVYTKFNGKTANKKKKA